MGDFRKDNNKAESIDIFKWGGILLISVGAITSMFISPPSVGFMRQYYEFSLEYIIFLILIFTLLLGLDGFWGEALSLTFTLFLFFLSLIYKWQTAYNSFMIGGLLPEYDANSYYQNAQGIIYGFNITGTASFRPIFTSFLAVIMKAVNGNLQTTLIILMILNALAVYFATRELQQSTNSNFAPAVYLVLCYMFFRSFSGTLLTENLGFCFGNLSLVFLIRGCAKNKLNLVLYGLFLLTIGLNARAGAFFILPTLAIWIGLSFRNAHGFWRSLFLGILAVTLGMAANWTFAKLMISATSEPFSNFSYVLYGIASGNKGWAQAERDYPNASTDEIYSLALQKIKEDPTLFAQGIAGAYSDYFHEPMGAFSFLLLTNYPNRVAQTILWALYFFGVLIAVLKIKQKAFSICLAFVSGIFLSVSLVPPLDSQQMRTYAATMPAFIYVISIGIASPTSFLRKDSELNQNSTSIGVKLGFPISIAMLIMCLILPVFIVKIGQPPKLNTTVTCPLTEKKIIFLINPGSSSIVESGQHETNLPHVNLSEFSNAGYIIDHQLLSDANTFSLKPGMFITISKMFNADTAQVTPLGTTYLITTERPKQGNYTICADSMPLGPRDHYYYLTLPANENQNAKDITHLETKSVLASFIPSIEKMNFLLLFILVIFNLIEIQRLPITKYPYALCSATLIIPGIFILLHASGLMPLFWEQKDLAKKDISYIDQFMYGIDLQNTWMSDTSYWYYPISISENNIALKSPHENKSVVKTQGMGSYTIRNGYLFFSASDNSDPRINQRTYKIETPKSIRLRYQLISYLLFFIGLFVQLKYINRYKMSGESTQGKKISL